MNTRCVSIWTAALLIATCALHAQMVAPQKEHLWLKQLAGEWEFEGEGIIAPDQPPIKSSGTESSRMIGDFWLVGECDMKFMNIPIKAVLTVGFDPKKEKYVGTWVDSMSDHIWHYEGWVDESGKVLTLEAEGPDHRTPGKMAKFRDIWEIKSENHKVLTAKMQDENGDWITFGTTHYRRKE